MLFAIFLYLLIPMHEINCGKYFDMLLNDTDLKGRDWRELWNKLQDEMGLRNIKTVTVRKQQLLLQPSIIIPICLKGSDFLTALNDTEGESDCIPGDYGCMLGSLAPDGALENVEALINTLDNDKLKTYMLLRTKDCAAWFQLFKELNPGCDAKIEMGRCLLQIISTACQDPIRELVRLALQ